VLPHEKIARAAKILRDSYLSRASDPCAGSLTVGAGNGVLWHQQAADWSRLPLAATRRPSPEVVAPTLRWHGRRGEPDGAQGKRRICRMKELFTRLLTTGANDPSRLMRLLKADLSSHGQGRRVRRRRDRPLQRWPVADAEVIPLLAPEIAQLIRASDRDWSNVEPFDLRHPVRAHARGTASVRKLTAKKRFLTPGLRLMTAAPAPHTASKFRRACARVRRAPRTWRRQANG
jgi:hypothetical protein